MAKTQAPPEPTQKPSSQALAAVGEAISRETVRLDALRRTKIERIIALEKQKIVAEPPSPLPSVAERARVFLNGYGGDAVKPTASGGSELFQLRLDVEAIDHARDVLGQKWTQQRAAVVAALLIELREPWIDATRELARAILNLDGAVRAREVIRERFRHAGGIPNLPLDIFHLRGSLFDRDEKKRFLEAAVRERLIDRKEIGNG